MLLKESEIATLWPLTATLGKLPIKNLTYREVLSERLANVVLTSPWIENFFPNEELIARMIRESDFVVVADGDRIIASKGNGKTRLEFKGIEVRYPWDILAINEVEIAKINADEIVGSFSDKATLEGHLWLGENSRILPGVYIEGNVVIGKNCKIGPNCYIRGNTAIGDNVHIGQAVEVKNSVIVSHTAIGHLSYVGDCVIGENVNFGGGTIISNFRHDGQNHRSLVNGELISTGRRKFGAIIGNGVHTGINTSIYPGRKLGAGTSTRPGEIVKYDLK